MKDLFALHAVAISIALATSFDASARPAIAAGASHSLAAKRDGTVRSWGDDVYGQLGLGRTLYSSTPVAAAGLPAITGIALGEAHVVALAADGGVWRWGFGVGDFGSRST